MKLDLGKPVEFIEGSSLGSSLGSGLWASLWDSLWDSLMEDRRCSYI